MTSLGPSAEAKTLIQAAASVLFDAALHVLQNDPHAWSKRPCQTCRTVTALAGKPFGCYLYAEQRRKERP